MFKATTPTHDRIAAALKEINHKRTAVESDYAHQAGITLPLFNTLTFVANHDTPVNQTEIANYCYLTRAAITGQLKRLEEARLIERKPNAIDSRANSVLLTERGRDLIDRCNRDLAAFDSQILDILTAEELATLSRLLETWNSRLD